MNCPNCGNPVEQTAAFCPKCFVGIAPQGWWQRFLSRLRTASKPARPIVHVEQTVTIKTTDEQGQQHEYHSLDDVPPEVRAEIEKLQSKPWKETFRSTSPDGSTLETLSQKTLSTFKITDEAGNERIYNSLDELPPEIRAALDEADKEKEGMNSRGDAA